MRYIDYKRKKEIKSRNRGVSCEASQSLTRTPLPSKEEISPQPFDSLETTISSILLLLAALLQNKASPALHS